MVIAVPHHFIGTEPAAEGACQFMQQVDHTFEAFNRKQRTAAALRARKQSQNGARHNTKRAFSADKQVLEIVTSVVLEHFVKRADRRAIGKHCFETKHEVACHAETQHLVATGIRRDVAAYVAGTSCAKIKWKCETCSRGGFLDDLQRCAGLYCHRHRITIEFFDPIETL